LPESLRSCPPDELPESLRSCPPEEPKAAMLSQYNRADEAPVPVTQYRVTLSSISSRLSAFSGWPSQSVHDQNFSTIHAACPAGSAPRPYRSVCGRVDCCFE